MRDLSRIALAFPKPKLSLILHDDEIARLSEMGNLNEEMPGENDIDGTRRVIRDADAVVTSWGSPRFTREILDAAPNLKIIAHAAGTVKGIVSDEVWKRGITVTSAAAANAHSVAQFVFSIMIYMLNDLPYFVENVRKGRWNEKDPAMPLHPMEPYRITVGIIGASQCGRRFIDMLRPLDLHLLLYDPTLSEDQAAGLGAKKSDLDELLRESDVVSIHAPQIPQTKHMINRSNLRLMRDGALLIQTSRGSVINEQDLIEELQTGRIRACLDVTDPEPPALDNSLRNLPNVILTPHRAGATGNGCWRMGKYAVDEVEYAFSGEPPRYEITREMLDRIA